jgi:hypothetical protein
VTRSEPWMDDSTFRWLTLDEVRQEVQHFYIHPGPPKFRYRQSLIFPMYRYTDQRWVDAFFESGAIRLSPLLQYRDTVAFNEAQADHREGFTRFVKQGPNGIPVFRETTIQNQWTICSSERRDDRKMMDAFHCNSVFRIDSVEFFKALNTQMADLSDSCYFDRIRYLPEGTLAVERKHWGDPVCLPEPISSANTNTNTKLGRCGSRRNRDGWRRLSSSSQD